MTTKPLSTFLAAIIAGSLAACGTFKTNQVPLSEAVPVPKNRVYGLQEQTPGSVPVEVVRDTGALGMACYLAIEAKRQLIARLDTGEIARFYIEPGEQEITVMIDPLGEGLCASKLATPVRELHQVNEVGVTRFRLSSRMHRRPELEAFRE